MKHNETNGTGTKPARIIPRLRACWLGLALAVCPFAFLPAEQFGSFTYEVINGSEVEITDYPNEPGEVTIPSEISGMPVTSIGNEAFAHCYQLASVTLPEGVTNIGTFAFMHCDTLTTLTIPASVTSIGKSLLHDCDRLTAISVAAGSAHYVAIDGVLCNAAGTLVIQYPVAKTGAFAIPHGVTTISDGAFFDCNGLTSVAIPPGVADIGVYAFYSCDGLTSAAIPVSVTSIGDSAFRNCGNLDSAIFTGDAPGMGQDVFSSTAAGFTVSYLSGSSGFTSPTWQGYPAVEIDEAVYPAAKWLLTHGLPYDTDLHQDLNGDGIILLTAYALDLDPHNALAGMPRAFRSPGGVSMTYYASASGINYTVLTSTDLKVWETAGVTLSDLDAEDRRTATIQTAVSRGFMRVLVED